MKRWTFLLGMLAISCVLSACATQESVLDLQRQLQTTRGELAVVRKNAMEARSLADEVMRSSISQHREEYTRVSEQIKTILSTLEAQQKAIASSNAFVQRKITEMEGKNEGRLGQIEERIKVGEKGQLASQGNLGARTEELAAELKIVQGRLEENNNLLAEQASRIDELIQRGSQSGSRAETTEADLKALKERGASQSERMGRIEEDVKGLIKSWQAWRDQADRTLDRAAGLERRLGVMETEWKEMRESPRSGVAAPPARAQEAPVKTPGEPTPPPGKKETTAVTEPASTPSSEDEEIYKTALSDYFRGAYDLAVAGFRAYLAKYPKASLAGNSEYWLGECYYSQKKYEQAIFTFDGVLRSYPTSQKAPSALLKKGYAYLELGDVSKGKSALREVLEKYPRTREAQLAESRLAALK